MLLLHVPGQGLQGGLGSQGIGVVIGGAHLRGHRRGQGLGQLRLYVPNLVQLAPVHDGVVEHRLHRGVQRLGPVQHAQDRPGGVQAPVPQADQQVLDHGGVLGVALDHAQGVLGAVDADAQRHHAQVIGEVHPVDHQRHQVQPRQVASQQLGQGGLGGGHEPPAHR